MTDIARSTPPPTFPVPGLEPFVRAEEAAAFLHMSPTRLKHLARQGKIPAHPLGDGQRRRWLFLLSELDQWVRKSIHSACDPCRESRSIQ
jgi:hypothetical protein